MNRARFYDYLRSSRSNLFGKSLSKTQVAGMEGLLDAFEQVGDGRADTLAYGLATAYHETGRRMVPVREGFATSDVAARRAVDALARKRGPQSAVARYARPQPPHGHVYYGRGHVQLTWLDNYRASSKDAGVDLVRDPDKMLDPIISARILFLGLLDGRWNKLKQGLRFYLDKNDWVGARRTVNVLDKAGDIAFYAKQFLAAIEASGGISKTASQPAPRLPGGIVVPPKDEKPSFWALLLRLFWRSK